MRNNLTEEVRKRKTQEVTEKKQQLNRKKQETKDERELQKDMIIGMKDAKMARC